MSGSEEIRAQHAAVASGHPLTTQAGASTLRAGGNAFDAAVAAGFTAAVTEPVLTSLGGGGFLLARTADGREVLYDFFVDTPGRGLPPAKEAPEMSPVTVEFGSSDQVFHIGLGAVAVPGNIAGLLHVHAALGRLPLADVLAPAASLAREGVELNSSQAHLVELVAPILTFSEAGRRLFAPGGRPLRQGERCRNPQLADFISSLANGGSRRLYGGDLAEVIERDMRRGAGRLTAADLAAYEVIERKPLVADYRGRRVLTNPAPSSGGRLIGLALEILSAEDLRAIEWGDPAHLEHLVATMIEVDRRRAATSGPQTSQGTTHISVVDGQGNVASMTTSNGEGSGYIVPGTGVMLNNMMGEDDLHPGGFQPVAPGHRVASMMSPSILVGDGKPPIALGSGGSKRIRTALLQIISDVVDFDLDLVTAIEAPRLHWDGDAVQAEPGFTPEAIAALARRWPVNSWPNQSVYFGGVHAVSSGGEAAADLRRGGSAVVIDA